jgi:dehydrogenase/reductase SDR family protein 1
VAALAADPSLLYSGRVLVAAAVAQEYGVVDVDGKRPRPVTVEEV